MKYKKLIFTLFLILTFSFIQYSKAQYICEANTLASMFCQHDESWPLNLDSNGVPTEGQNIRNWFQSYPGFDPCQVFNQAVGENRIRIYNSDPVLYMPSSWFVPNGPWMFLRKGGEYSITYSQGVGTELAIAEKECKEYCDSEGINCQELCLDKELISSWYFLILNENGLSQPHDPYYSGRNGSATSANILVSTEHQSKAISIFYNSTEKGKLRFSGEITVIQLRWFPE